MMIYTSDQQLNAMGVKRIEDLPRRRGFKFRGVLRDGSSLPCETYDDKGTVAGDFEVIGRDVSANDLIGWWVDLA